MNADRQRFRRTARGRVVAALAALLAAGGIAACGEDGETAGGGSGGGSGDQSACVERVTELVEQEKAPMELIVPEASFAMTENRGKSIWYISPSQATGYALALSKSVTEAGREVGMDVQVFDGKGQPDRFTQGLVQAVAQGADGIVLYGIDPALVPEGLQRAKAADVPVLSMSTGKPEPPDGTIFAALNTDIPAEARYMAHYAAFVMDCEVNAATTYDTTYPTLVTERDVIEEELAKICPDTCEVQDHKMKLPEMATALAPSTQSLIQRNPDLNIIFATFDQAATYQIPAVEQSGSDVKIVGTNGLPPNLDAVREGSAQIADISYVPPEYFGWLGVDQLGREMLGEPTGDENGDAFVMPVQTFDQDNLPDGGLAEVFPNLADYQTEFRAKWGM